MREPLTGNYKGAFKCKKCPQRGDSEGCPMWWEIPVEKEDNPTEVALMKGCGYALMPLVLNSVVKSSWTGAAEVSKMRSEVVDSVRDATGRFLQLHASQAEQLSAGEVVRHNESRDRLVHEGGHERLQGSTSVDVGTDS